MKQRIEHGLDQETARRVARAAADSYTTRFERFQPQVTWLGDDRAALSFNARGIHISARLELEPGAIVVDIDVPLLLRPFKGRAQQVVERELQKWTDKAARGEV